MFPEFDWQDISPVDYSIYLTEVCGQNLFLAEGFILTGLMVFFLAYSSAVYFNMYGQDKLRFAMNMTSTTRARDIVIHSIKTVGIAASNEDLIQKFKTLIENNLMTDNFTVAKISKEIGISKSGFTKKIKDLTGLPPKKYIMDYKLQKAKVLLLENNVSETALLLGFYDARTFGKIFKRKFGISPSEYRKEELNKI